MKLSTNFIYFEPVFGLEETIDIFSHAGFEGIDFNLDQAQYYSPDQTAAFYRKIRAYAASRGVSFFQAHAPFGSSFSDEERSRRRFEDIVRSIEFAGELGAEFLVVHPCSHIKHKQPAQRQQILEYNLDFFSRLLPHAQNAGIRLAIENIPGSITEEAEGLKTLLHTLNSPVFSICFDVGHAQIMRLNPAEFITSLGDEIGCTHFHDNDGISDLHTLPFFGVIAWEEVMKALADVGYRGNLSYEAGTFVAHLPNEMRPIAARYMADTGRYLIERFRQHHA